jgi:hypothetical protein
MPRDLLAERKTLDAMPELSRESASPASPPPNAASPVSANSQAVWVKDGMKNLTRIHPFAQLLSRDDLDDCDWLEHAAFDPIEAATRDKVSMYSAAKLTPSLQSTMVSPVRQLTL